jgi:hypothetical protein
MEEAAVLDFLDVLDQRADELLAHSFQLLQFSGTP